MELKCGSKVEAGNYDDGMTFKMFTSFTWLKTKDLNVYKSFTDCLQTVYTCDKPLNSRNLNVYKPLTVTLSLQSRAVGRSRSFSKIWGSPGNERSNYAAQKHSDGGSTLPTSAEGVLRPKRCVLS